MDENKTAPAIEQNASSSEIGANQLLADQLDTKIAPSAAEASQSGPKADDGMAAAQAQVASVSNDDGQLPVADPAAPPLASPMAAADVDVIEPEWVKKAEQAVAAHRDDPHGQEDAVEAIQVEYLKQRYNIDVKPGDTKP